MAENIDTILHELRTFKASDEFIQQANIQKEEFEKLTASAKADPVGYWESQAENLHWFQKWDKALDWKPPFAKWFVGGKTNASYNCIDRHLKDRGDKVAILWEGEDGQSIKLTYQQLHERVCQLSNALKDDLGLKAGDTAAIYMPMVPEAAIAMLACARIGVTHSIIFAGFSARAIKDRVLDAKCKAIFTADINYRKGEAMDIRSIVAAGVEDCPCIEHVIVLDRQGELKPEGREKRWQSLVEGKSKSCEATPLDSEHPLFFLYTSGTTGKPKGIVHSTAGYMVNATLTTKWVMDLKEDDVYWCTADVGWITGHTYVVYGCLSNGGTTLMFEGNPAYPHAGRIWEVIEKHKVTVLYTAPTAIRAFMRAGDEHPAKYKMDSLRLLGTVGEPINPEAWVWYHEKIGRGRCPIVDTWWQTETGAIMISPLPGVTETKPGSATLPLPGVLVDIFDEEGKPCGPGEGGYLVITHPWPSMLRDIHDDSERFKQTYWSKYPGIYFAGDGANKDSKGFFWIKGRVDDVINVSGHRLGTMEIESALVSHPSVAEAAVVGIPHELKGQGIFAYVTPMSNADVSSPAELKEKLKAHVVKEIGALARPEEIRLTKTLPKTRSGKIMRRVLRDLAAGKEISGDTTTLENPDLVQFID